MKYNSFKEYCEKNSDRNNRFNAFIRYALKTQGYVETIKIKPRHCKDVEKFLKRLEEAYQATKKSTLVFKLQKEFII